VVVTFFVAEPQCDDGDVDAGAQQSHGGGVAQHVRSDVFAGQGGTRCCRGGGVHGDALGEGVQGERVTTAGWEQWIRIGARCLG
jgi:hypothetical protein